MDTLVERCPGLDAHKAQVTATVRIDERGRPREQHTQTFATTTRGLLALADWLASWQVTRVGMEPRGVLEAGVLRVGGRLRHVAAQRAASENVPGRKTDVADSVCLGHCVTLTKADAA